MKEILKILNHIKYDYKLVAFCIFSACLDMAGVYLLTCLIKEITGAGNPEIINIIIDQNVLNLLIKCHKKGENYGEIE